VPWVSAEDLAWQGVAIIGSNTDSENTNGLTILNLYIRSFEYADKRMIYQQPARSSGFAIERAAELFGVLSTPARLHIITALFSGEQNVTMLLSQVDVSQPSMSRHLNVLYQSGVLAKRRCGQNVFYRIADDMAATVCKAVCFQVDPAVETVPS
jgi:DNA-binding transcriptional ArsR family regulator